MEVTLSDQTSSFSSPVCLAKLVISSCCFRKILFSSRSFELSFCSSNSCEWSSPFFFCRSTIFFFKSISWKVVGINTILEDSPVRVQLLPKGLCILSFCRSPLEVPLYRPSEHIWIWIEGQPTFIWMISLGSSQFSSLSRSPTTATSIFLDPCGSSSPPWKAAADLVG